MVLTEAQVANHKRFVAMQGSRAGAKLQQPQGRVHSTSGAQSQCLRGSYHCQHRGDGTTK